MLHDAAPARLSAYFVSFGFVPPYLSQPPARGIYRLWDRYQYRPRAAEKPSDKRRAAMTTDLPPFGTGGCPSDLRSL